PAPAVTAQDSRISAPPSLPPPSAPARLTPAAQEPTSLRGTEVDGELLVDARGNLVLTGQVRHLFDYFLSLIGEESSQQARQRIRDHLTAQLDEPARSQALELLETYLDYQYQLVALEARFPVAERLEDLLAREQAVQQLRARLFSREAHEAFFAGEEIYNNFTLERLTIQQDPSLSDREKGLAIEALRENLPEEMQQLLVPQIHNDLREQTLARSEQAGQQLRASLFCREAHEAFSAGEEIYSDFTLERLTIQQDPSLSDREKGLAIEALRENLPEEMQQLLVPQIHNDLREQTLAPRAAGADEGRIRQLRMGMLGPEATERLEELDRSRAEWRER